MCTVKRVVGASLRPDSIMIVDDDAVRFPITMRLLAYFDAIDTRNDHNSNATNRALDSALYATLEDTAVWL